MRPAGRDEVEVLAGGVLEEPGAVDDVVVVHSDEPLPALLSPRCAQAAKGHVRPSELKRMVVLRWSGLPGHLLLAHLFGMKFYFESESRLGPNRPAADM